MTGDSPPLGPKPKSAVPSYLLNGAASVRMPSNMRERENLNSSIKSSFARRQVVDPEFAAPTPVPAAARETTMPTPNALLENGDTEDQHQHILAEKSSTENEEPPVAAAAAVASPIKRNLSEPPRDPRDHTGPLTPPLAVSRPASPYTLNPPIDFDGLSWPSM